MKKLVVAGVVLAFAGGLQAKVVDQAQADPLQKQGGSGVHVHSVADAKPAGAKQSFIEAWYQRKLGRNTPSEEARLNEERASTAYRAEPAPAPVSYIDQQMRAKIGRTPGR
jgi:hypothetical protein